MEYRDATAEEIEQFSKYQPQADSHCAFKILEVKDLCIGDEYALHKINLRNRATLISDFVAGKERVAYTVFISEGDMFMKGEPMSYALTHLKTDSVLAFSVTPKPIQVSWDDGATIIVTAMDESMLVWYTVGYGFQPGEALKSTSKSWHEVMESESQASGNGRFVVITLPGVIGKTGGINYVTYERDNGEKRTLEIPYGNKAFR